MSLQWTRYAYSEEGPSNPTDRWVLVAIISFADKDDDCSWPSIPSIVQRSRLSERKVRDSIRALERDGYLSVLVGGGRSPSLYTFHKPKTGVQPALPEVKSVHPSEVHTMPSRGAQYAPQRGTTCPPEGHRMALRGAPRAPELYISDELSGEGARPQGAAPSLPKPPRKKPLTWWEAAEL